MRHPLLGLFALACLALLVGTTLVHQHRQHHAIAQEHARLTARQNRQRQLAADIAQLTAQRLPTAELARLHALATAATPASSPPPASTPRAPSAADAAPGRRAAADWRDAGSATPAATFETFVLAATEGDIDRLATLIAFEPVARAGLEATFAGLSAETRANYGTPEKLVATLLAVQVPRQLAAFTAGPQLRANNGDLAVILHLETTGTSGSRSPTFTFRPAPGCWRLLVPNHVLQGLANALAVPPAATPPGDD